MMKTYRQLEESGRSLNSFLEIGDEVDPAMTEYFLETRPLETRTPQLIQSGRPYDHFRDADRKVKEIYATLKRASGKWIYAGLCFSGESEPAKHHLFVTLKSEAPDFGHKYYRNICNPAMWYLQDQCHQWDGLDSKGRSESPLKAGLVIHICGKDGRQISEEVTKE
ncbi:MAG: hypothetical protein BWY31_03443 [Lentisphaerae bacterium ADurb.Bin242]|nr:MAG: hypothetical protein BWY31_03443 [Lentisphaerae bacterium ADurb.Bin242]